MLQAKKIMSSILKTIRNPLLLIVFFAGIIFWGGFNTAMEATNTLEFCISCHEMESTVYQEYKQSVHFKNISGVQTQCSDCHVPKEWFPKLIRKIQASAEVYHWITGKIDTQEKFDSHRLELAKRVWATMKETDSRECRNCHTYNNMQLDEQDKSARKKHLRAIEQGETCIDCHKGIAHELPEEDYEDI